MVDQVVGGSDNGGMGLVLPIILVASLVAAVAFLAASADPERARQRVGEPPVTFDRPWYLSAFTGSTRKTSVAPKSTKGDVHE